MKQIRKQTSEAGFTLVELMVSLAVGALLIGSVHTVYTNQLALSQQTRDTFLANAFAESKIESLRSKGYLAVNTGTSDISAELPAELHAPRSATLAVSDKSPAVKNILLTINYRSNGKNQTYTYTTYLGELGVGQY